MGMDLDGEIIDLDMDVSDVELRPMPPPIALESVLRSWPTLIPRKLVYSREWAPADEVVPSESTPDVSDTEPAPPPPHPVGADRDEDIRRVGKLLAQVAHSGLHTRAGFASMADFCEALGVDASIVQMVRKIFDHPTTLARSTSEMPAARQLGT